MGFKIKHYSRILQKKVAGFIRATAGAERPTLPTSGNEAFNLGASQLRQMLRGPKGRPNLSPGQSEFASNALGLKREVFLALKGRSKLCNVLKRMDWVAPTGLFTIPCSTRGVARRLALPRAIFNRPFRAAIIRDTPVRFTFVRREFLHLRFFDTVA
jgi:hypothetical protein